MLVNKHHWPQEVKRKAQVLHLRIGPRGCVSSMRIIAKMTAGATTSRLAGRMRVLAKSLERSLSVYLAECITTQEVSIAGIGDNLQPVSSVYVHKLWGALIRIPLGALPSIHSLPPPRDRSSHRTYKDSRTELKTRQYLDVRLT